MAYFAHQFAAYLRCIDSVPDTPGEEKLLYLLGNGYGHIFLGFASGGPEMRGTDNLPQLKQGMVARRLLFKYIQGCT